MKNTIVLSILIPVCLACINQTATVGEEGQSNSVTEVISPPLSLTVGGNHNCALMSDNNLYCWGYNDSGQLGIESRNPALKPTKIKGEHKFKSVVAGGNFTCGSKTKSEHYCWGGNVHNQLGFENKKNRYSYGAQPGDMSNLKQIPNLVGPSKQLIAGSQHACSLSQTGELQCFGQSSSLSWLDREQQKRVSINDFEEITVGNEEIIRVASGPESPTTWLVTKTNDNVKIRRFGLFVETNWFSLKDVEEFEQGIPAVDSPAPIDISSGFYLSCILTNVASLNEQRVMCFGSNKVPNLTDNLLGYPDEAAFFERYVHFPTEWQPKTISAGYTHACSILQHNSSGETTVSCWGANSYGQLGLGISDKDSLPQIVDLGDDFIPIKVHAGQDHTCVFGKSTKDNKNHIKCFGRNDYGQLGLGDTNDRGLKASDMGDNLPYVI